MWSIEEIRSRISHCCFCSCTAALLWQRRLQPVAFLHETVYSKLHSRGSFCMRPVECGAKQRQRRRVLVLHYLSHAHSIPVTVVTGREYWQLVRSHSAVLFGRKCLLCLRKDLREGVEIFESSRQCHDGSFEKVEGRKNSNDNLYCA